MLIQCDKCGKFFDSKESVCPECGTFNHEMADNPNKIHGVDSRPEEPANGFQNTNTIIEPKTISELKKWYFQEQLPAEEVTRFFIGYNIQEPRIFGIYKDQNGEFVVYKNKADGSRAIRYQGLDEAYAVREFWLRLKEEMQNQRNNFSHNHNRNFNHYSSFGLGGNTNNVNKTLINKPKNVLTIIAVIIVAVSLIAIISFFTPNDGYYYYNNKYYYYLDSSWYSYNSTWHKEYSVDEELRKNFREYYLSGIYNERYNVENFTRSYAYREYEREQERKRIEEERRDRERERESSSSSSYDSWDSSSTDWDSDW